MEENVDCYMSEASTNIRTDPLTTLYAQTITSIHKQLTDTLCTDELTNFIYVQQFIQTLCYKAAVRRDKMRETL